MKVTQLTNANRITITGSFLRIASIQDDEIEPVDDPLAFLSFLKNERHPRADLFTFAQRLPDTKPKYTGFFMELDNVAAIPVSTYEHWWTAQVDSKLRNKVRKFEKKGAEIKISTYDDSFVKQIMNIYDEAPIRQGRYFWHYQKPFEAVKSENGTYPERSVFMGAYYEGQLIGFLRLVYEPGFANILQILSMIKHRDKAPTNALLAKAVDFCAGRKIPYLVYAKYVYGRKGIDTLSDFKQHNGFVKIDLPRYFIPLTFRGRIALKMKLQHGFRELVPQRIIILFLHIRTKWYSWRYAKQDETEPINRTGQ